MAERVTPAGGVFRSYFDGQIVVASLGRLWNNGRADDGADLSVLSPNELGPSFPLVSDQAVADYQQGKANYQAASDTTVGIKAADVGAEPGVEYYVYVAYSLIGAAPESGTPRLGFHQASVGAAAPVINTTDPLVVDVAGQANLHKAVANGATTVVWADADDTITFRAYFQGTPGAGNAVILDTVYLLKEALNNGHNREDSPAAQFLGPARATLSSPAAPASGLGWGFYGDNVAQDAQTSPDAVTEVIHDEASFQTYSGEYLHPWRVLLWARPKLTAGGAVGELSLFKNGILQEGVTLRNPGWNLYLFDLVFTEIDDTDPVIDYRAWVSGGDGSDDVVQVETVILARVFAPVLEFTGDANVSKQAPADEYDAVGDPGGLKFTFDIVSASWNRLHQNDRLQWSDDGGATWQNANPPAPPGGIYPAAPAADSGPIDEIIHPGVAAEANPETVTIQAHVFDFYSGLTSDPVSMQITGIGQVAAGEDQPTEGISIAFENATHELAQSWTRLDDPAA